MISKIELDEMSKDELVEYLEGMRVIITNPDEYSINELKQRIRKI